ncbi:unnamed protein product [Albugo candida]|uniref:Uncharacterized protein n=1 Tax=Albugo candida TaxID=65357 RepID=A0A024FZX2_9STRA|nr:unnamed protein product [Albugo candida]|eukprot:CCI39927.1 unnamed protein product [Albugo candida]
MQSFVLFNKEFVQWDAIFIDIDDETWNAVYSRETFLMFLGDSLWWIIQGFEIEMIRWHVSIHKVFDLRTGQRRFFSSPHSGFLFFSPSATTHFAMRYCVAMGIQYRSNFFSSKLMGTRCLLCIDHECDIKILF